MLYYRICMVCTFVYFVYFIYFVYTRIRIGPFTLMEGRHVALTALRAVNDTWLGAVCHSSARFG